jgi:hypothetical protein
MQTHLGIGFLLLVGVACQQQTAHSSLPPASDSSVSSSSMEPWRKLGDSLTLERQRVILQKLMQTAEKEGWGGAVRYCYTAAETLTTYRKEGIILRRVALRNRNPKNALEDSVDRAAHAFFSLSGQRESFVRRVGEGHFRYYRPIYIGMPQCLKCHGRSEDLDGQAWAEIRKRYPVDKATGFSHGELRGLWRMDIQEGSSK